MSTTYDAIVNFYGKSWQTLPLFDLSMTVSHVAMSIGSGSVIELSHFDGFMNRKKQIQPIDRLDAVNALCELSQVLRDRVENMPPAEIAELDRIQSLLNGSSAQTVLNEEHQ
jgi:hypothetical protein